jgi:four helix bundle protein
MVTVQKFEDLEIWRLARKIYQKISKIATNMKRNHDYRFADQIKAAAGSVMDNIAEGFERNSRLEFLISLSISKGECGELESQLYRALDDGYIDEIEFKELYDETDIETKKIASFIIYLNNSKVRGLKFKNRVANTTN